MAPRNLPNDTLKDVHIFIIDDEDVVAWNIENELKALGAEVLRANSVSQALDRFPGFSADLVISDIHLPDGNGLELLKKWRMEYPELPVILITAHGQIDSAITALRLGAFDYLQKPFDMKDLVAAVTRTAEISKLRQKVSRLEARESKDQQYEMVGHTAGIQKLRQQLEKVAKSKADTVLILGESGTGKELAARAIHWWSDRAKHPFVEINCASIPENLLESELFGFEKGAFTDARERKLGLFEMARNGTIFLDEIGELPLKLQAKLLRALEYRRFKRLGGTKDIEFSGRIVVATNRNLLVEVAEKRFRDDLYYRLNALPIRIPALHERLDDVEDLTKHFMKVLSRELGINQPRLSAELIAHLKTHRWPGNVRELKNTLQRALIFSEPEELKPEHIEFDLIDQNFLVAPTRPYNLPVESTPRTENGGDHETIFVLPDNGVELEKLEMSLLQQALDKARNNQTRAAHLLGISRHTLRYRMEKYGLVHV